MSDEELQKIKRQLAELSSGVARLAGDVKVPTFAEFAQEFLRIKLLGPLRPASKRSLENSVRMHLIPGFGGLFLDRITNPLWVEWIEKEQIKEGRRLHKFFNVRKTFIAILRSAVDAGHISKLPKLDDPDIYEPVGRVVEDQEIFRVFWKARRKHRFIFYVFWAMGNRPREILKWEWSMIRWNEPGKTWIEIPAKISKTKRNRTIPIAPFVSKLIYIRFRRGNGSPFVFPSRDDGSRPQLAYSSAWITACRHAKVDAMPYDMRRTRITKWLADGKSVDFVAKQLDTSPKMIHRVYLKNDTDVMEGLFR